MGVGGNFWDLLKPNGRHEGFDFLRNKRVAVDLSYWIVQHETAIKAHVRNPHLRLTFFRTINLFSKFGAFPVFIVDGTPSSLKSRARISRFYQFSGVDVSNLSTPEHGVSVERSGTFVRCVQECVELLELLGMPVLKAKGEAEALCAQLNRDGFVDACVTADSDAFLYGAKCVVKSIKPNSKEPVECYDISDIEKGLGIKREHFIAISLLVGNDHNLNGVQGIGPDTAVRFVKTFEADEILSRLREIGSGRSEQLLSVKMSGDNFISSLNETSPKMKIPHCSYCGHPGNKRAHSKGSCEYCIGSGGDEGCLVKPLGFKCDCSSCVVGRRKKNQKKLENWQMNVCKKIATEHNFPNDEIIEMYLANNHGYFSLHEGPSISWGHPKIDMVVDFLAYHQLWEPSYIRQRMLPMLSTIFLREMISNPVQLLLHGQYEFDSIKCEKIRYGHRYFVVKWKKASPATGNIICVIPAEGSSELEEPREIEKSYDLFDDPVVPLIDVDDGCWFLLTDENMQLVHDAFPEKVELFLKEKELNESKRHRNSCSNSEVMEKKSESAKTESVQLSITEFYRSTKILQEKQGEVNADSPGYKTPKEKRKVLDSKNLSKSARRRLLFK
ncbi:XPG-I domain [Dillenia turbinata]|uniref:Flap endonuclease GEN-like 1 n=1 Tax=Dillenia turbinata TaxID=194707 RepID=A0AAN8Z4C0_9MAGN